MPMTRADAENQIAIVQTGPGMPNTRRSAASQISGATPFRVTANPMEPRWRQVKNVRRSIKQNGIHLAHGLTHALVHPHLHELLHRLN